jgi:hypothetical protein
MKISSRKTLLIATGFMISVAASAYAHDKKPAGPEIVPAVQSSEKTGMTNEEARAFMQHVYDVYSDPKVPIDEFAAFFSPAYTQDVDGKVLNYSDFINHLGVLRSTVEKATITIQEIATNGSTVADIHIVDATKKNGEKIRLKVLAFYKVENGKFVRLDELTHLLEGSPADRDLGSRLMP